MKHLVFTATLLLSATSLIQAASNDITVTDGNGKKFKVQPVAGDGDCAFTAIGKSRLDVVTALKAAVDDHGHRYEAFDKDRDLLHDSVMSLVSHSPSEVIDDVLSKVQTFILDAAGEYTGNPNILTPSMLADDALAEFRSAIQSGSAADFVTAQRVLQNRIHNMYYERYEAFETALKQELQESGVKPVDLKTKAQLKSAIDHVFKINTGKSSWLPMGLIFGVQERLGLNLAVWSSQDQSNGQVKLYQFSAPNSNVWDASVQHIVWRGGHFDRLLPQ